MNGFHHEAVFYTSDDEYLDGLFADICEAVDGDGAVLVAVSEAKAQLLRDALGDRVDRVQFTDMERLGRNPACIIPAWREFVRDAGPGPLRRRRRAGLARPQRRRAGGVPAPRVAAQPRVRRPAASGGCCAPTTSGRSTRPCWRAPATTTRTWSRTASRTPASRYDRAAGVHGVGRRAAAAVAPPRRARVHPPTTSRSCGRSSRDRATQRRLCPRTGSPTSCWPSTSWPPTRCDTAAATVSCARWEEDGTFLFEVRDGGRIDDPLAGRERPSDVRGGGRGLWLVNHLCDLVQVRSSQAGNVVRLHMSLGSL